MTLLTSHNKLVKNVRAKYFADLITTTRHFPITTFNVVGCLLNPDYFNGLNSYSDECLSAFHKIFKKGIRSKISTPVFFVDISCPNCPIFSNFTPIYTDKLLGIDLRLKTL